MRVGLIILTAICLLGGCANVQMKKLGKPGYHDLYDLNETAIIEDIKITVEKAETFSEYKAWKAKDGNAFLVFRVSIDNESNKSVVVSPAQFNVVSATERIHGAFQTNGRAKTMQKTRVKARQTLHTTLLFEVPQNEKYEQLIFAPDFADGKSVTIRLT
ncbi:MAG: DUF4352 domain-containing protein [Ectobacillus sp.]